MTPADFWARLTAPSLSASRQLNPAEYGAMHLELRDRLNERGCTWLRATDMSDGSCVTLYMEGWINRPDVEAPFDLQAFPLERQV